MYKKYFVSAFLLCALASLPVFIYSQSAAQAPQEKEITIRGLGPLSMLKQQEKADIIAVAEIEGEKSAYTILQNVSAFSAGREGGNSRVRLILLPKDMQAFNTFEAQHPDAVYILTVRNKADTKASPIEVASFTKLFN